MLGAFAASGVAVLLALQLAKPDIPERASGTGPRPSETAPALAEVAGLQASTGKWNADPGSWAVALSWDPVEGVDHYLVGRDGRPLDEVPGTAFTDEDVAPEQAYSYEVVAVDASGAESKPASVRVQTGKLPEADARVEGKWVITLKVESSSLFEGGGKTLLTLEPTCKQGPCDVSWGFPKVPNSGTARARGARYVGTATGGFLTRDCHGGVISSTSVTLDFKVTEAHAVRDEWRATRISGTIVESVPAVSNCVSARNVWSFEGAVQG